MKCINRIKIIFIAGILTISFSFWGCQKKKDNVVADYETTHYNQNLYEGKLYAEDLCVAGQDVSIAEYTDDTNVHGAALFDIDNKNVLYSYQMHEKLYPASVTKILTALVALENGNLEDSVTISPTAAAASFPSDAQVIGLQQGDIWTLKDLLYALLLYSGNDAATAIAEHVSGSEEAFVELMNARAGELMANNTHFTNPHGLHDADHYTTAYDLYLIFNECIKNDTFVDIIETDSYDVAYTHADGSSATLKVTPTNLYAKGAVDEPAGYTIVGGKTGTTGEAGYCLILLERNSENTPYISVVMGASDKPALYADMTSLIEVIPEGNTQ